MMDDELRDKVNRYLMNQTDFLKVKDRMTEDQMRHFIDSEIANLCNDQNLRIDPEQRGKIIRELVSAVVSLGPLRPIMEDETITEVMINGAHDIYIQRHGRIIKTDVQFNDNQHLLHTIQKILAGSGSNKRVDESSPYVDFTMTDGSRVNIILPPCSSIGPVMTIRKFRDDIASVEHLLELGEIDEKIATLLIAAMKGKLNVIFCGATGSGKTTLLNVFSQHIPSHERIITIEDTPELRLLQEHVVTLSTKPPNIEGRGEITMRELFVNCLRMRPDRIIIGEVRGGEMLDMIQSISSGHSGSLGIVHAETPLDCFDRMVTMMLMTGLQLSTPEIRRQVARSVDIIVHVELYMDGKRRVSYVTDIIHNDQTGEQQYNHMFEFNETGMTDEGVIEGHWKRDARLPSFHEKFTKRRVELPEGFFDKPQS